MDDDDFKRCNAKFELNEIKRNPWITATDDNDNKSDDDEKK